jgi:hypothetical protein
MMTSTLHHPRPALVALATLAGLLLAPGGASAGCEAMKSAGACPPSMVSCCCTASAEADAPVKPQGGEAAILAQEVCPAAGSCSCEERPEAPAEPAREPARLADDGRADRGGTLDLELPDLRPSPFRPGLRQATTGSPAHVPLYLRNSRFLI